MIYLDHAAATNPYPRSLDVDEELYANPSSIHAPGQVVRAALDKARLQLARDLECQPTEIVFTSGATEAIHLAIIGHYLSRSNKRGVVYTSPLVHSCVWSALSFLETHFAVEVRHLPIDADGFLDLAAIGEAVFAEADLIVTEFGNSEIGLLQPVTKLGKALEKWVSETGQPKPALIVDAAAAVVTEKVALEYQKCDFIALSAEKFGGLKGSGLLLHRTGVPLTSIIGGSHELGYRGGTENVMGALALSNALQWHEEAKTATRKSLLKWHQLTRAWFTDNLPSCQITTPVENFLPHVFHFILPSSSAALFVAKADQAGLAISAGSACSSGTTTASKVLLHLGLDEVAAGRGVRLSFGRITTPTELREALEIIKQLLSS